MLSGRKADRRQEAREAIGRLLKGLYDSAPPLPKHLADLLQEIDQPTEQSANLVFKEKAQGERPLKVCVAPGANATE